MLAEKIHFVQFRKFTTLLAIKSQGYDDRQVKLRSITLQPGDVCPVVIKPLTPLKNAIGNLKERCHMFLPDATVCSSVDPEMPLSAGDFAREVAYDTFQFIDLDDD